eukprot:15905303-Heterocapsa_arctica.AAC.1
MLSLRLRAGTVGSGALTEPPLPPRRDHEQGLRRRGEQDHRRPRLRLRQRPLTAKFEELAAGPASDELGLRVYMKGHVFLPA